MTLPLALVQAGIGRKAAWRAGAGASRQRLERLGASPCPISRGFSAGRGRKRNHARELPAPSTPPARMQPVASNAQPSTAPAAQRASTRRRRERRPRPETAGSCAACGNSRRDMPQVLGQKIHRRRAHAEKDVQLGAELHRPQDEEGPRRRPGCAAPVPPRPDEAGQAAISCQRITSTPGGTAPSPAAGRRALAARAGDPAHQEAHLVPPPHARAP